jgi:hypothetical protein
MTLKAEVRVGKLDVRKTRILLGKLLMRRNRITRGRLPTMDERHR